MRKLHGTDLSGAAWTIVLNESVPWGQNNLVDRSFGRFRACSLAPPIPAQSGFG